MVVLVAGVVVVLDGVVVVVVELVVVEVEEGVVVVLEGVVLVVEGVVVGAVVVVRQSRWDASLTVLAPWSRFARSVGLTVPGRLLTELANEAAARAAPPHWPASTAAASRSSLPLRLEDSSPESRFEPPPQATRNETANPSPAASRARGA